MDDLNYLNTAEIKSFCKRHSIPYTITIEINDGRRRNTNEDDRKGITLSRIRHFLKTGVVLRETCFRAAVACFAAPPEKLAPDDRLFYGQYNKTNHTMINLLKNRPTEIPQWSNRSNPCQRLLEQKVTPPTLKEYASAWLQFALKHTRPNAEWAFLSDRARGTAGPHWKKLRAKKAAKVMKTLHQITSEPYRPKK